MYGEEKVKIKWIPEIKFCNCKKTKCLKLYCDCFSAGELCIPDCKCTECCNNS